MKAKQTSIRFNQERLKFVKEREGLKTEQKVVEFLIDQYWWQHKLNLSPGTAQAAAAQGKPLTEFETIENDINRANSIPLLDIAKKALLESKTLNQIEKRALMQLAVDKVMIIKVK